MVKELKTTAYRPRSVLLGSREQLCVHPEVSKLKGGLQNRRCGVLTANHGCRCVFCVCVYVGTWWVGVDWTRGAPLLPLHHTTIYVCMCDRFKNNLDAYQADNVGAAPEVLDIEELVGLGKGKQVCMHAWWWWVRALFLGDTQSVGQSTAIHTGPHFPFPFLT